MPLAVTHVLTSIIIVDLYRDYVAKHKKYFSMHTVFLAGFFGLLPDLDIPIGMVADFFGWKLPLILQHGGITHTPAFAFVFLIPAWIFWKKGQHKRSMYFSVGCVAILVHLFLDYLIGGGSYEGIMWIFPFTMQAWKIHLLKSGTWVVALDALLLLGWLWHEEIKHKIADFI
jgi:membrane-bound metal-dependent hydrolase YbcI (DUF457 family)